MREHIGSKSIESVRERLRLAKKKEVEVDGKTFKSAAAIAATADGEGKVTKSPTKSPRKPKNSKPAAPVVKDNADEAGENGTGTAKVGGFTAINASENENDDDGKAKKKAAPKKAVTKRKASEAVDDGNAGEKKKAGTKRKASEAVDDDAAGDTKKAARKPKPKANKKAKTNRDGTTDGEEVEMSGKGKKTKANNKKKVEAKKATSETEAEEGDVAEDMKGGDVSVKSEVEDDEIDGEEA